MCFVGRARHAIYVVYAVMMQVLDTITELVQGNQDNQSETLNHHIIKSINLIVAFDTHKEADLKALTETKQAAVTILEAMLEQSNEKAREVASTVRRTLNMEELYLAMNRLYYIDFYLQQVWEPSEHGGDPVDQCHLRGGFEMYYVLARLRDLTGSTPPSDCFTNLMPRP